MFEAYASFAFLEHGEGKEKPTNQEPASSGLSESNVD
jgi:hypothetical protein